MRTALLILLLAAAPASALTVRHDISAEIDPPAGTLAVSDRLSFPEKRAEFVFSLHRGLAPTSPDGRLEALGPADAARYGINYSSSADIYEAWRFTAPRPVKAFTVRYAGTIAHPLGEQAEEYARSFSETPGLISKDGCYLSGASGWYPQPEGALVTYRLKASLPPPYSAVSGGDRVSVLTSSRTGVSVWDAPEPQDEITLACGPYTEYSRRDGRLTYYAFLRRPDPELAARYLEADARYIGLYSALIGPYPYGKFALVENFWETGYGLPSFTLLGPAVIRLPFILNSSYPHEILHNWWGNGVFVDYAKGNWCEGLTAYLADYLIAENRGKGREYRMAALQKYSDYVRGASDFPLTAFRSRHSSASEAVGYGKSLMFYHMLRRLLGDGNFIKGLRAFYSAEKFRTASYADLRAAFEKVTGSGRLAGFFAQWTERAGAPELALGPVTLVRGLDGYDLEFTLTQKQAGPAYALEVPAAVYLEGLAEPRMKVLRFDSREETFHYTAPVRPVRIEIDPEFDVFRKLSPLETPPTLSRLLGAERPRIFLPPGPGAAPWAALAAAWTKDRANLPEVLPDTAAVPGAASYWVFGGDNALARGLESSLAAYGAAVSSEAVTLDGRRFPREGNTFVLAGLCPGDTACSAALVISDAGEKLGLLASKLPHYGKYSWLVFDKDMVSVASGIWKVTASPLAADLPGGPRAVPGGYPVRRPLAVLPSVFQAERIGGDARALASLPGGRAPGTPGHAGAEAYITSAFRKAGLKPFRGGSFAEPAGRGLVNLVGMAEGTAEKDKYVFLSAHYDHLPAAGGQVYPGADDNASGVALLLELARWYGAHPQRRTVVFAAFDGEEDGRAGSRAFAASLPAPLRAAVDADLNFDTVGRLGSGKVLVLGSSSSDKWVHIFRGAGFVTGTDYDLVKEDLDSSDQASFIGAGIPAVQFFSGPNADYHRPTDTPDKLDIPGIVRQAEFAREVIDYLAGDSDFLTRPSGAPGVPASAGRRGVSTGLVPDFSFPGPGVRAQDVTPGSPLAATAFRPGDVITAVDGVAVDGLKAYSEALKKLSPGTKVRITFLSGGEERSAELELAAR